MVSREEYMKNHLLIVSILILLISSTFAPISLGSNVINSKVIDYIETNESLDGPPIDSAWPMYQHDAANTGYSQASFPDTFNQIWFKSYQEDFNKSMDSFSASPVASNGKIFITGESLEQDDWGDGVICALNQNNGSLIWKKVIPPFNDNAGFCFHGWRSPAVYEGKIFTTLGCFWTFDCRSKIIALDENTGDILWEKSFFGTSVYSSVTVADDKVFVVGHLTFFPISWLYVFDVNNGDLLWRKTLWGYIETTPVVYDNKVFVAPGKVSAMLTTPGSFQLFSGNSRVYALNIDNGEEIWMKRVKGHLVQCSPVAANGKLFVPSNMFILRRWWICRISALDADTGDEIWYHDMNQKKGGTWPSSIPTPSVGYGKVFVTDSDGWLRVWEQESGDLIWKKEIFPDDPNGCCDTLAPPVIIDGKVIVGVNAELSTRYNELFMFDVSNGEYIWSIKLDEESGSPFIVSNEMLFVSDGWNPNNGLHGIYAFG
jgi:outer membrane protein assembly factor BamB